jgi:hypothetical protein
MPHIAVTRLHVRDETYLDEFIQAAFVIATAAEDAHGCEHAEAAFEPDGHTLWTRSVWIDRLAMRRFMVSDAHGAMMPMLREWCDEAAMVDWEQDDPRPPRWADAHDRLQREGRASTLDRPSPAHERFMLRVPAVPG